MMSDENIIKFGDFNYDGEEKNKSQIILSHTSREAKDYINSLKQEYNIVYTQDIDFVLSCNSKKISYIMYIIDDRIINKFKNTEVELSFLNTEPLSIKYNLDLLKDYIYKYPFFKIVIKIQKLKM